MKNKKFEYETFWIDSDAVYKALFYDDQTVDKMFKRSIKLLKNVELDTDEAFRDVYRLIKKWCCTVARTLWVDKKTKRNCFRYWVLKHKTLCC